MGRLASQPLVGASVVVVGAASPTRTLIARDWIGLGAGRALA